MELVEVLGAKSEENPEGKTLVDANSFNPEIHELINPDDASKLVKTSSDAAKADDISTEIARLKTAHAEEVARVTAEFTEVLDASKKAQEEQFEAGAADARIKTSNEFAKQIADLTTQLATANKKR